MSPAATRRWRIAAGLGWLAAVVAFFGWSRGVSVNQTALLLICISGLAAASIGRASMLGLVRDFLPLFVVMTAYLYLRGAADTLGMHVHWFLAPRADRAMFFGVEPTVWVQHHLMGAGPRWWDVPITLVYSSFFVIPWIVAAALWRRDRSAFRGWTTRWMVMSLLGFAAFAVAPTAPPWAAARCTPADVRGGPVTPTCLYHHAVDPAATILGNAGEQAHAVFRVSWRGFDALHVQLASRAFQTGENVTDQVAAAPSLHAAGALLVSLFLWRRVRARWRPLLAVYPPAMGFALVYGANHYVFDILVGWAFALLTVGLVRGAEALVARRRAAAGVRTAAPAQARDDVAVPVLS